jgi:hypothetical protein
MTRGKVLAVGSNATRIEVQGGGTGPTGNYLNETVVPAMALIEAGYHLVLATPNRRNRTFWITSGISKEHYSAQRIWCPCSL